MNKRTRTDGSPSTPRELDWLDHQTVKLVSLDRERGSFSVEDAVDLVTQHWGHRSDLGMVARSSARVALLADVMKSPSNANQRGQLICRSKWHAQSMIAGSKHKASGPACSPLRQGQHSR